MEVLGELVCEFEGGDFGGDGWEHPGAGDAVEDEGAPVDGVHERIKHLAILITSNRLIQRGELKDTSHPAPHCCTSPM